ncbi:MAG: site-specific DNA-methyltransferase [Magnetococcus sp. YQC-5]
MAINPKKQVETLTHDQASRKNLPTAEFQSVMAREEKSPIRVAYERRNLDLDPQLVWRGKDEQDWSDLVVHAPPLYIQEKVKPKALIDDLQKESESRAQGKKDHQLSMNLFSDFNGLPDGVSVTDFYQHDAHWTNRMILGDSLQVMVSLAEREGLRGKVQCIYFDPPYGIKFNSNFQWSTTSRDVKDGKREHISREPEQVKAFRDTWRDGIHSYLTYLRDRLTVARDLLADSGSIFVQIGDENVHRVRAVMDEVFGENNFIVSFIVKKKGGTTPTDPVNDYLLWACKNRDSLKFRNIFDQRKTPGDGSKFTTLQLSDGTTKSALNMSQEDIDVSLKSGAQFVRIDWPLVSQDPSARSRNFIWGSEQYPCAQGRHWTYDPDVQMPRLAKALRLNLETKRVAGIVRWDDWPCEVRSNLWDDTGAQQGMVYVVQTPTKVVERCLLMTTDPGDLVLDPTCGSGTTAYVAEQWGRRWITIDTSRVALALARARIMGARFLYYLLADSPEGQKKEAECNPPQYSQVGRRIVRAASSTPYSNLEDPPITESLGSAKMFADIRQGFVYERVPHITLKSIANNQVIDLIWERFQQTLEPLRHQLNTAMKTAWEEWEIPREVSEKWSDAAKKLHAEWWKQRIARQKEIDASIAAKAEFEYLYDKPYEDKSKVRVAGPFTVESLSPHRVLTVDQDDNLVDPTATRPEYDFASVILENLKTAGVQQAHKENKITFTSLTGWPGNYLCAEGRFMEGEKEKRAGIFIGPEFGTVTRENLIAAARETGDAGFDLLIVCAFSYDAHCAGVDRLGRITVLKARMNADLHMADTLKNTGKGNLFVIFGEPDIAIQEVENGQIQVKIHGVDVFHPQTGEVHASGPDGIACWFIDTDYNEESFFVRHAYFLGANDPYKALKTTLKAEIDREAWESLHSDISRPFKKPKSGRIAVKVINHLGDEVMKVFGVS